jgi:hypothetical protein
VEKSGARANRENGRSAQGLGRLQNAGERLAAGLSRYCPQKFTWSESAFEIAKVRASTEARSHSVRPLRPASVARRQDYFFLVFFAAGFLVEAFFAVFLAVFFAAAMFWLLRV